MTRFSNSTINQPHVQIGFIAGRGSGQTTFLGALPIAVEQHYAGWMLSEQEPACPGWDRTLSDSADLLRAGRLPEPSAGAQEYQCTLTGPRYSLRLLRDVGGSTTFDLRVRDQPAATLLAAESSHEIWEHLADCDALVYLFDPGSERRAEGRTVDYLKRSVELIRRAIRSREPTGDNRLPHALAVCVTKFDEYAFFGELDKREIVGTTKKTGLPYVRRPEQAFALLDKSGNLDLIYDNFHPPFAVLHDIFHWLPHTQLRTRVACG